jgi:hypothetical protein
MTAYYLPQNNHYLHNNTCRYGYASTLMKKTTLNEGKNEDTSSVSIEMPAINENISLVSIGNICKRRHTLYQGVRYKLLNRYEIHIFMHNRLDIHYVIKLQLFLCQFNIEELGFLKLNSTY